MKKISFFALAAVALTVGMTACNNQQPEAEDNATVTSYTQISIQVPNDGGTRAGDADDSGVHEEGTADEYAVQQATLYFFNMADPADETQDETLTKSVTINTFTKNGIDGNKVVSYNSGVTPLTLADGTYKIYALVNTSITLSEGVSKESDLKGAELAVNAGYLTDITSGIPMSSRKDDGTLYAKVELKKNTHTRTNPALIPLTVERAWGKIQLRMRSAVEGNTYTIYENGNSANPAIGTVELEKVQVVNLTKQNYAFRQVGTMDGAAAPAVVGFGPMVTATAPYVIAPLSGSMTTTFNTAITAQLAQGPAFTEATAVAMPTATDYATLCYANENTMYKDAQLRGYATAVIFQAHITPASYVDDLGATVTGAPATDADLYFFDNQFFTSLAGVNAKYTFMEADATNYSSLGIYKYTESTTYYQWWISHYSEGTNEQNEMEYAIVRNNVYKLYVDGIRFLGKEAPEITDPDKPKPIEDEDLYINVRMEVKPWIVRENAIVFN